MALGKRLEALIEDPPDWLDGQARARVDGTRHSLGTRVDTLGGWLSLLGRIGGPADPDFVDWLAVDRFDGREYDAGLHRPWPDPARPVAETVYRQFGRASCRERVCEYMSVLGACVTLKKTQYKLK